MAVIETIKSFRTIIKGDHCSDVNYKGAWISKLELLHGNQFKDKYDRIEIDYSSFNVVINWDFQIEYNEFGIKAIWVKINRITGILSGFITSNADLDLPLLNIDFDISKFSFNTNIELSEGNNGCKPDWIEFNLEEHSALITFN